MGVESQGRHKADTSQGPFYQDKFQNNDFLHFTLSTYRPRDYPAKSLNHHF